MEPVGAVYKDGRMVAPEGYELRDDGSGLCDPVESEDVELTPPQTSPAE